MSFVLEYCFGFFVVYWGLTASSSERYKKNAITVFLLNFILLYCVLSAHLYQLREDVCHSGSKGVEQYQHPEIEDCRVLSQESVPPHLVPSQGFHNL